ncbi:MAG: hypothetical protein O2820_26085 [Planctomycetota bacterium]|nr:hypothetical protein [Planctomycetota bacterium]MDA1252681.1 hypothetical protein [Planctomycetota bacterium]
MDLTEQIENEIKQLAGFSSSTPRRVEVTDSDHRVLGIGFVAVDTMSVAFESMTLHVPELVGHETGVLREWADALSNKVTYLLENIGPIEIDERAKEILIRSTPPVKLAGATQFYEVLLGAQANGTFLLRRYRSETGQPGRQSVDIQLTHETLRKLVGDLVETIPDVS